MDANFVPFLLGGVVLVAFLLYLRHFPVRRQTPAETAAGPALAALAEKTAKNAEVSRGLESRMKHVETEWTDVYNKLKRAQGRLYRDEQVKDGKHKGAVETKEPVEALPLTHADVTRASNRRRLGLG